MSQGNVSQVIKIERDGRVYSIVVESSILDLLLNEKTGMLVCNHFLFYHIWKPFFFLLNSLQ